jgi:hypothetical protein
MNHLRILLAAGAGVATLALGVPSAAHPEHSTTKQDVREIKIVKAHGDRTVTLEADKEQFAANCGKGRKFESTSTSGDDKNRNVAKMVICSDPDESDEAWAKTLKDALAKVETSSDMPDTGKAQIIADLKSEIARLGK